jgi:hypothetical protein
MNYEHLQEIGNLKTCTNRFLDKRLLAQLYKKAERLTGVTSLQIISAKKFRRNAGALQMNKLSRGALSKLRSSK